MSRNAEYEARMKAKGLKKVTVWMPEDREADIRQAINMLVENDHLTLNSLRDVVSGKYVSMHRHQ
ncbi:hypothetical protein [Photobacterium sp. J15]|uniref:antitoxin MazE-like protein n=1 Tax=Photobacterium sp. J15 TaxID=265901 RepID=UPI0007E39916|nr:hypothetical protein [Photobacterium sp. J15]